MAIASCCIGRNDMLQFKGLKIKINIMWTSFERKPLKWSWIESFPEAVPVTTSSNEATVNEVTKTIPVDITKLYTPEKFEKEKTDRVRKSIKTSPISATNNADVNIQKTSAITIDQTKQEEIINIDVDYIVKQIQDVLKSPSPLTLYKKSTELKENFAQFINYLVKKIALGFNSDSKTIILNMYQNARYEKIWFNNLKIFLDETKFFDVRMYFKSITKFDKEKQYIAKSLLKIKCKISDDEIEKYLNKYDAKTKLSQIKNYYKILNIENINITEPKYLDENKIEVFLENLYFNCPDLPMLFQIFCFDTDQMKWKFKDIYDVFSDIAQSYLKTVNPKTKLIYEYLYSNENKEILAKIDRYVDTYINNKKSFYREVASLLIWKNTIERSYFWSYVKTRMIDTYFKEVSRLFYWDKNACENRNEWSNLRWNFSYNPNSEYAKEINEILQFKQLILELNTNLFAPFLKPLVYAIVSEKLSISRKDLLKIRYLMTLVLSENYQEYKKIYNFFEDLEAFMDYNIDDWLIYFNFWKIKIFAADILLWIAALIWLYIYSPVWVFVATLILSLSYIRSHFFRFRKWIEWNLWIRPLATAMLVISSFYWLTNLDTTKIDIAKLSSKVEKMWVYKTDVATKIAIKKIWDSPLKEAVANILQSVKK